MLFVVNHPNGLIDPVFLLCFTPRPVAFLAKAPLFRMPLVGLFVRALDSIPVYRPQDPGTDMARNVQTFAAARAVLSSGRALALFPEGASHAEAKLRPARTGAARIALGAAASGDSSVRVVPAGLYYTRRDRFRSGALLHFGAPLDVPKVELEPTGEPPRAAVRELTDRIERALDALTFQADSRDAIALVSRAERVFAAGEEKPSLSAELDRRRRFVEGAARFREADPVRFENLARRIERFDTERREAGLSLRDLSPGGLSTAAVFRLMLRNALVIPLAPLAIAGAALHYPAYRAAGWLATRFASAEEDVVATIKIGSSLLLFPATWLAFGGISGAVWGWRAGAAAAALAPISGYLALRGRESLDAVAGRGRALAHLALESMATRRLLAEREAIRQEIRRLAEEYARTGE